MIPLLMLFILVQRRTLKPPFEFQNQKEIKAPHPSAPIRPCPPYQRQYSHVDSYHNPSNYEYNYDHGDMAVSNGFYHPPPPRRHHHHHLLHHEQLDYPAPPDKKSSCRKIINLVLVSKNEEMKISQTEVFISLQIKILRIIISAN